MKPRILIIEDEKIMRITLSGSLREAGYEVLVAENGKEGLSFLENNSFDLIITDVKLPDMNGLDITEKVRRESTADVIVMTAYGTIKDAVAAIKLGALDYITKPFSLDEFHIIIERAFKMRGLKDENLRLKRDIDNCYGHSSLVGEGEHMKKLLSLIEQISSSDSTVLITGESGTGKEMVATTIHYWSNRKNNPYIKVNCAALPEGLIESELFGHEKGAFTGAHKRKSGKFEAADGGTIFLDEIGDLRPEPQAKILRVLQERRFERVGATDEIEVDVRVIAATNKDLELAIGEGDFREDLYYRLNVIPIEILPLRERKEDIVPLVNHFLEKCRKRSSRNVRFSKEAFAALLEYDYPGNVRELENIVERCVTLSVSGIVEFDDLPSNVLGETPASPLPGLSSVASMAERDYILKILSITQGNKTKAAEMLGISRKTLWEKLRSHETEG